MSANNRLFIYWRRKGVHLREVPGGILAWRCHDGVAAELLLPSGPEDLRTWWEKLEKFEVGA